MKARTYRDYAENLRIIADGLTNECERDLLASVASDYERLASLAEEQGRFRQILEIRTP